MNSTAALLTRSLRLQARSSGPHVARLGLLVMLALIIMVSSDLYRIGGAAGRYVLIQISWCLMLVGTAAGITQFAGAVAEEKEEGNIGLLRLAGLGPGGLLVGIGLARLWDMLLLTACTLPVAVLAVTLGGVSIGQVAAVFAAIVAWFCCLAGLGLLASTVSPTAGRASSLVVIVLLCLHVLPAMLAGLLADSGLTAVVEALHWWQSCSVWTQISVLSLTPPGTWWSWQVVIDLGLGAAGVIGAWLLHARCARDTHDTSGERSGAIRRWLPIGRPRRGLAALAWKDFHCELGGWGLLILKAVVVVIAAVFTAGWLDSSNRSLHEIGKSWAWPALAWIILEVGIHLSRLWSSELRNRTAELLCMLPPERATVAYAKLLALPLTLAPPLVWLGVGMAMAPDAYVYGLGAALSSMGGWYGVILTVFWWQSAAWLSLRWPRFALGGSIILVILVQIVIGVFAIAIKASEGVFFMGIVGLLIPLILMHAGFAARWVARI